MLWKAATRKDDLPKATRLATDLATETQRKVRNDGAMTVAHLSGVFKTNPDARAEFYRLIDAKIEQNNYQNTTQRNGKRQDKSPDRWQPEPLRFPSTSSPP